MRLCILKTIPSSNCTIMQRYILGKALTMVLYGFQSTLNLGPVTTFCWFWNTRQNANIQRRNIIRIFWKCSQLLKFWNILIIDKYVFRAIFHFYTLSDIYLTLFFPFKSFFMWPSQKNTQAKKCMVQKNLQENNIKPPKTLWGFFFFHSFKLFLCWECPQPGVNFYGQAIWKWGF